RDATVTGVQTCALPISDLIEYTARAVRQAAEDVEVYLSIQTNGALLDDRMVGALAEHQIHIGVSLDGGPAAHDRHRRYRSGRGRSEERRVGREGRWRRR